MSRLKIEQLSVRTNTNDGLYGVDIPFSSGLNIIHAENTHGKSTCIQSIVYALGLEGTLGPSRKVPLKTALTSQLRKANGSIALIFESKIYLQISNGIKTITIMRSSI
ncbi:TPA: AAA family ATPase, partial [Aeromonas veronii]